MSALSRPGPNTEVIKEGWFYLGTALGGAYGDAWRPSAERSPMMTLLVTRAQLRRSPSGKVRRFIETDALRFANEAVMVAWIEEHHAEKLPPEADGNPQFVPEGFDTEPPHVRGEN
jgi:hypothetical protein